VHFIEAALANPHQVYSAANLCLQRKPDSGNE